MFFKVAPRVEKTEASKKVDILQIGVFASCIMKKHFLLCTKETVFFPYFYHEITFYSAELFDSVVHFKFYLNISVFKQTQIKHQGSNFRIKKQPLISGSAVQRGFGSKVSDLQFCRCFILFEDFGHICSTCSLQNFS